jgi:electron transfer flavoprotein alpha subunit
LSKYGVDKVLKVKNDKLAVFTAKAYADVITQPQNESASHFTFINNDALFLH